MTNCPMDCSYCVLQSYFNFPAITVFTNWDDLWVEMAATLAARPGKIQRLGTGEFGDSLALDELLGLNRQLISFISRWPNMVLEIKTKWHRVEPLLPLGPNPQVIFGWSLNTPRLIRQEEHGAAPLATRLEAAHRCAQAGFRLAFHFDPLIYYPGWEEEYQGVVRAFDTVPAEGIAWISLGALRYMPPLKNIIRQRFPASRIAEEEFITALDSKKRYYKTLRFEMFHGCGNGFWPKVRRLLSTSAWKARGCGARCSALPRTARNWPGGWMSGLYIELFYLVAIYLNLGS